MRPEDLDASMPGLPPVQREVATVAAGKGIPLGAPCTDCKPAHHLPAGTGWFCDCGAFDPFTVQDGRIDLSPVEQNAIENALAYEQFVAPIPADNVNLPKHYARFKIEPIRFICENKLDFFQGNIVKYTLRHDAKNGQEDLDKVIRYATMYKAYLAGDPDWWKVRAKP